MKLSPPASSSDLEAAREVARRLHEQRRQSERPVAAPPVVVRRPVAPATPAARLDVVTSKPIAVAAPPHATPHAGVPHPVAHATPGRPQRQTPAAPPVPEPPPLPPTPPPVVPPPRLTVTPPVQAPPLVEPPRPAAHDRPAAPPRAPELRPEPAQAAPPSWDEGAGEVEETEASETLSDLDAASALAGTDDVAPAGDDDAIEIEETGTTLEEMVGAAGLPSVEPVVGPPDLDLGEAGSAEEGSYEPEPAAPTPFAAAPSPFDDDPGIETEELFDLPPTPSWDEVVENCLMIAHARGAMLIDPAGHVLASNGFWPEPGPEPIATKLVTMMEKTLKDAPTRSVSAPVGAMHLTAWRVPLAEGLITVAFLADAPLRAEVRTPVDAEILRGAP